MYPYHEDRCYPYKKRTNALLETPSTIAGAVTRTGQRTAKDSRTAALGSAKTPWEAKVVRST